MPSMFGERVSSVLDVHQRSGAYDKFNIDGGIGLVSSRLTLGGPIKKDTASFIISGRRTYIDQFFRFSNDETIQNTRTYFYDLNAKLNYFVNKNNYVTFTGYLGRDVFDLNDGDFKFDYGNRFGVLNWYHVFGDYLNMQASVSHTDYNYSLGGDESFLWTSRISTFNQKLHFDYEKFRNHKIGFGVQNNNHHFRPGLIEFGEAFEDVFGQIVVPQEWSMESGTYIQDEIEISDKITVMGGVRFSLYNSFGQASELVYESGLPKNPTTVSDTINFSRNEITSTYGGVEPRFSFLYKIDTLSSLKFAYNRNVQYMQLVSNTTSGLPLDVWKAADYHIVPLKSNQIALGYVRSLFKGQVEGTIETYYKRLTDVLDYKNNADLFLNTKLEQELLAGEGRSYGLELMFRKKKGKFTGWLSYTLSRSEILVDSEFAEETINNGQWYRASYDKPHDLTFVGTYHFNDRISASVNFVYATGRAITFPDSKYEIQGIVVPNYSSRNQGRLSDYHRLDLSAKIDGKKNDTRRYQSSWVFSVYNVYSRRNAYSYTFANTVTDGASVERLSILGSILPSVTYNFNF